MSHHDQHFLAAPPSLLLSPADATSAADLENIKLVVKGQGTILLEAPGHQPFTMEISGGTEVSALRLEVSATSAHFLENLNGTWNKVASPTPVDWIEPGLDEDAGCPYWFSIDSHNRRLRYGKGEMRKGTMLMEYSFPPNNGLPENDPYGWVSQVSSVAVNPGIDKPLTVWRDPVTIEPPLRVKKVDAITMDDMATYTATVAANLSTGCQQLYDNVAGDKFQLDTPDFPMFSAAIEASIVDENGWCNKVLKEKATEFGEPNPEMVYLRITMGVNQGDSPGIPFVMEIWPPGCYSPIHNHAGSNAIIKVLHGEIFVKLFPMLSEQHQVPFATASFGPEEVTWITPGLNQIHQLHNINTSGPTCITIQCYQYPANNNRHYPYFDYLGDKEIEHFEPDSDCDFLRFKEIMREEWDARKNKATAQ